MPKTRDQSNANIRRALLRVYGPTRGIALFEQGLAIADAEQRYTFFSRCLGQSRPAPVDVETFARDAYYWGMGSALYPTLVPDLIELNSGRYEEALIIGGIGTGKTTICLITCGYQLYRLSCDPTPQATLGLDPASEIVFVFQNLTQELAQSVSYAPFREHILKSPYFRAHFPPDPGISSELRFPNRIVVRPVSGSSHATIGQNVYGGLIDELNYMAQIHRSLKSVDGGRYDQAQEAYNGTARRRKSRFSRNGRMPGILCLSSSNRSPGEFTERKLQQREAEISATGKSSIFLYNKRVWDVKPDAYSKKRFRVFTGTASAKPRILAPGEVVPALQANCVIEVPDDFRTEFNSDLVNALREIAGISYASRSPFFVNPESIARIFSDRTSIFSHDSVDFVTEPLRIDRRAIRNPQAVRFVHIDLASNLDSAGFAIGHCAGLINFGRDEYGDVRPRIVFDGVLEIRPPKDGEIQFEKIRELLIRLLDCRLDIKWIGFDTWQSKDSIQYLRSKGLHAGECSITIQQASVFKTAVNEGRVDCPHHVKLHRELIDLQLDYELQKIGHLPHGSKDLSDAVMGVCYALMVRREAWDVRGIY